MKKEEISKNWNTKKYLASNVIFLSIFLWFSFQFSCFEAIAGLFSTWVEFLWVWNLPERQNWPLCQSEVQRMLPKCFFECPNHSHINSKLICISLAIMKSDTHPKSAIIPDFNHHKAQLNIIKQNFNRHEGRQRKKYKKNLVFYAFVFVFHKNWAHPFNKN